MKKKLYVLTRKDLTLQYASVQAGHGVAQYLLDYPSSAWNNNDLIYLGVKDEVALERALVKLKAKYEHYSVFKEPDLGNELTSFAIYGDEVDFRKFKLLAP